MRAGGEPGGGHGLLEAPGEPVRSGVRGRARPGEGRSFPGGRAAGGSMKKNQTVQGTFSKLFGKKHANPPSTSLYATNPPWIFTQEAPEEGSRDFGKRARGGGPRAPGEAGGGRRGREGTRCNLRTGRRGAAGKGRRPGWAVPGKGRGGRGAGKEGGPCRSPLTLAAARGDDVPSSGKLLNYCCQKGFLGFIPPSRGPGLGGSLQPSPFQPRSVPLLAQVTGRERGCYLGC